MQKMPHVGHTCKKPVKESLFVFIDRTLGGNPCLELQDGRPREAWHQRQVSRPAAPAGRHRPVQAQVDRFSKRMPEITGERGCFSGKERARRLLEQ